MDAHGLSAFVTTVVAAAVPIAVPILFAALGEIVAEKAGIINIGIEGMMLLGAWAAYVGAIYTGSLGQGALLGALAGALLGLGLAVFYVSLGADQVVTGILSNILVLGVTNLTYELLFRLNRPRLPAAPQLAIPGLSAIPGLGPIFFNHGLLDYLAFGMVPVTYVLLHRTWFGLNVRAVGEHPEAADTAGISVHLVRYAAIVFAGIMAALGGATLAIDEIQGFVENATAGRGFIALAVVVLAKWHPVGVLGGVALVGIADALQLRLQAMGLGLRPELLLMLPYLLTIAVLVGFVGEARYPAAAGLPYRKR